MHSHDQTCIQRSDKQCWVDFTRCLKDWRWWRYMWGANLRDRVTQFRMIFRACDDKDE